MPGPRSGYRNATDVKLDVPLAFLPTADIFRLRERKSAHRFCRNGEQCTGTGCVIRTGKTDRSYGRATRNDKT